VCVCAYNIIESYNIIRIVNGKSPDKVGHVVASRQKRPITRFEALLLIKAPFKALLSTQLEGEAKTAGERKSHKAKKKTTIPN
jgi:hypothetical protein